MTSKKLNEQLSSSLNMRGEAARCFQELEMPKIVLIYGRPGHGKSTLIKNLLQRLQFNHLAIVSSTLEDSYPEPIYGGGLSPHAEGPILRMIDIEWEQIDMFKEREGIKVLVMDDILHIETNGNNAVALRSLFSTSRHFNLYIIVGVQLLKSLSKALRFCCHVFITGTVDEESKELLATVTGKKKRDFDNKVVRRYEFIFASISGALCRLKLGTVVPMQHVSNRE